MSKKEKNKNPNRKSPLIRVISIISILLSIALIIKVIKIDILPLNFEITILGAVLLLTLILFIFYNFTSHSKIARVFGGFMIIVVTLSYGLGYFYLYKTAGMLSTISTSSSGSGTKLGSLSDEMTNNVSVIVMKSSNYNSLKDLSGKKIGTTSELDAKSTEKCLTDIKKSIDFDQEDYPNYNQEMTDLYDGRIDGVILDESSRGIVYEQFLNISQVTKVVHTTSYKAPREHAIVDSKHPVDVTKDPFTIYFSGNDSFGDIQETSRTDSNMLVTVNPKTHRILMTSIPRDYYVPVACAEDAADGCPDGQKDKLTHTGLYGVQTTINTIEDFMDVDINYYVRVNFSSLTNIVDAIGGVDVTVGKGLAVDQFYTDDTIGGVVEGENHLDGQKALAYARERYAYEDGDLQRVKNQQQVLKAIIKKVKSPSMLLKYASLIDAIGSAIETNMPSSSITNFVKFQLASNSSWKFESYPMVGDTGMEFSPSLGDIASVTYQDRGSIETAHDKIEAILNGENASSVKDKAKQLDDSDVTGDDDSQAQTGTGSYQDYTQSAETYVPDDSQDSSYEDQTTYDDSSYNQGYDDSYSDYGYGEY
ncbi:hypothetical protein DW895_08160 [Firmicutes bacterium AM41-11]|nr:hypothetical protein DW895_08160 [Firmicutes bacterium AM41-11]